MIIVVCFVCRSDVHSQQRWFYMGHHGEISVDQAHRGYTVATDAGSHHLMHRLACITAQGLSSVRFRVLCDVQLVIWAVSKPVCLCHYLQPVSLPLSRKLKFCCLQRVSAMSTHCSGNLLQTPALANLLVSGATDTSALRPSWTAPQNVWNLLAHTPSMHVRIHNWLMALVSWPSAHCDLTLCL